MQAILCLVAVALTCLRCVAQDANSASIEGMVMVWPGDPIAGAKVELNSGMGTFGGETDDKGRYQVGGIASGEFAFKVRFAGFKTYQINSIRIAEREQLRMPDTQLDVAAMCGRPSRKSLRILSGPLGSGNLKGSVYLNAFSLLSPFTRTTVTLVCEDGRECQSTRANLFGKFEFRDLATGWYDLKVSRKGFYPMEERRLPVSAGLEQTYSPLGLDKCPKGNCDSKLQPIKICE